MTKGRPSPSSQYLLDVLRTLGRNEVMLNVMVSTGNAFEDSMSMEFLFVNC
jgi:hypothetical protein